MPNQPFRPNLAELPRYCPDCGRPGGRAESDLCEHCGATLIVQGYCPVCESRLCGPVGSPCPKHDVELLADDPDLSPPPTSGASVSWSTVRRFPATMAAAAARIRLEAEGIPTFVEGERMGTPAIVKLQVPAELTAEARIILDQGWDWPADDLDPEDDPLETGDLAEPDPSAEPDAPRWSFFAIELVLVLAVMATLAAWLLFHALTGV